MVRPSNPPSKLAHTPSFSVSLGQVPPLGLGVIGFGFGFGLGFGFGFGFAPGHVPHASERVKNRRLRAKKSASEVFFLEAMISTIETKITSQIRVVELN